MTKDNNKNKPMTKKELKELAAQLAVHLDGGEVRINEEDLNYLSVKIVARMMNIQTLQTWHDHVTTSNIADQLDDKELDMTEEEKALGDGAKYMTLMNIFEDKEEYEKCAIIKNKLRVINKILKGKK